MKHARFVIAYLLMMLMSPSAMLFAGEAVIEHFDSFAIDGNDIWLGTNAGVVQWNRVEGVKNLFTVEDGLAGLSVNTITIDHDGVKWFGTDNGLSRFDGDTWTTYTQNDRPIYLPDNGPLSDVILHFAVDRDNTLWVGTGRGLSAFDGVTWTNIEKIDGRVLSIKSLVIDSSNVLWFTTNKGLYRYDGAEWRYYDKNDGIIESDYSLRNVAIDAEGNPWVSLCHCVEEVIHYLQHYDGDTFVTVQSDSVFLRFPFTTLHIDRNDENNGIWYDRPNDLTYYDGENEIRYPFPSLGQSSFGCVINDMDRDDDGILWMIMEESMGSISNHFLSFDGTEFTRHDITLPATGVQTKPEEQNILYNHPNPFNPSTTITFSIPAESPARLMVYDVSGRLVETLVDGMLPGGKHSVQFDGSELASGMYLYRLENSSMAQSGKMLLVK